MSYLYSGRTWSFSGTSSSHNSSINEWKGSASTGYWLLVLSSSSILVSSLLISNVLFYSTDQLDYYDSLDKTRQCSKMAHSQSVRLATKIHQQWNQLCFEGTKEEIKHVSTGKVELGRSWRSSTARIGSWSWILEKIRLIIKLPPL